MYIYFDRNGTIKEVINDESIRRGSSDYNKIYCYLEGNPDIDDIWYLQKKPDGTLTNEVSFVDNVVTKAIPYDSHRDMKYFQDFEEYQFYVFTLSSSYLLQSGLVVATIRVEEDNTMWALGELTFNVQANIVNSDNDITQSQYDYLLLAYASRTLNEQTGSDLDNLLDEKIEAKANDIIEPIFNDYKATIDEEVENQNETIASLGQLQPSGVDTTTNILAKTSADGIWISTTNGHWYYWNGTQYVDGGVYATDVTYAMKPYPSTDYNDCNSVPTNSIITILSNNSYANMPNNHTEGTLLTFNQYSNAIGSSGQTQIFVSTNNKAYTRIKWGSVGWTSWEKITTRDDLDNIDIFPIALYGEGATQYPDLNNVPNNKILTYTTTTNVTNLPVNRVGTLFTFCAYQKNNNVGCVQIYVTEQCFLYWRIKWGNVWKAWKVVSDNVVIGYDLSATYPNLNNVPNGHIITYTAPLTNYTNLPDNVEGTLYAFGAYRRSDNLGQAQIYAGSNNVLYTRIKWGSGWTSWKTITSQATSSYTDVRYDDYIYSKYDFNNKSVLWCGDSIIRGETIGGVVVDYPVAKLFSDYFNMTYNNIAVGGARFVQTGSSSTILGQLTNNQLRNIDYLFIGAGVNDNGANVDIDDFKEAIEDVLNYIVANYNSNIKVFFITPIRNYQNSSNNDKLYIYRNAITETIIKYNDNRFNVIQGDKFDFPLYNSNATYKTLMSEDGLHPTQLGYSTAYLRGLLKALN